MNRREVDFRKGPSTTMRYPVPNPSPQPLSFTNFHKVTIPIGDPSVNTTITTTNNVGNTLPRSSVSSYQPSESIQMSSNNKSKLEEEETIRSRDLQTYHHSTACVSSEVSNHKVTVNNDSDFIPNRFHYFWNKDEHLPGPIDIQVNTWKKYHPGSEFTLWNDVSVLRSMKTTDQQKKSQWIELYVNCKSAYGRMKIAEYHILQAHGGVFFEVDSRCLKSLDPFMHTDHLRLFAGFEPDDHAQTYDLEFIIGSAIVGSVPDHPLWNVVYDLLLRNFQETVKNSQVFRKDKGSSLINTVDRDDDITNTNDKPVERQDIITDQSKHQEHLVGCEHGHTLEDLFQKNNSNRDPEVEYGSVLLTFAVLSSMEWIEDPQKSGAEFFPSSTFYPLSQRSTSDEMKSFGKSKLESSFCVHYWKDYVHPSVMIPPNPYEPLPSVFVAILARNKSHVLPMYLNCIEQLEYPKDRMHIFVHTNDNTDDTINILRKWVESVENKYERVEMLFGKTQVLQKDESAPHKWAANRSRLDILASIRQHSLKKAADSGCDYYFVADCDNFVLPHTLFDLVCCRKPIVGPLLHCVGDVNLSNFVMGALDRDLTNPYLYKKVKMIERGIFPVSLVHNTYLIDCKFLSKLTYKGSEGSFEFVNFSASAIKSGIGQYICNKRFYGFFLHFFKTTEEEMSVLEKCTESLQSLVDGMIEDDPTKVEKILIELEIHKLERQNKMATTLHR